MVSRDSGLYSDPARPGWRLHRRLAPALNIRSWLCTPGSSAARDGSYEVKRAPKVRLRAASTVSDGELDCCDRAKRNKSDAIESEGTDGIGYHGNPKAARDQSDERRGVTHFVSDGRRQARLAKQAPHDVVHGRATSGGVHDQVSVGEVGDTQLLA